MRFTAPDAEALSRNIHGARARLAQALTDGDEAAIVDHAADLGGLLTTARQEAEAVELLNRHAALADTHPHVEQAAWFWNALATALQYRGERQRAEGFFEKAVAVARAGGWQPIEAMTLHHWGRSLVEQGRFDEAETRLTQALAIREALGDPRQDSSRSALAELARLRAPDAA